jgi:hypothetical protein
VAIVGYLSVSKNEIGQEIVLYCKVSIDPCLNSPNTTHNDYPLDKIGASSVTS